MIFQLNICTFNIGCGYHDFDNMLSNFPSENKKLDQAVQEMRDDAAAYAGRTRDYGRTYDAYVQGRTDELMHKIEKSVAERLAKTCDVICLQEVGNMSRHFVRTLERNGFKVYCANRDSDFFSTAIALRKDKFEDNVVNFSKSSDSNIYQKKKPYGQEIASVAATLKNSPLSISFTSLHSPGFQLFNEKQTKQYSTDDKENIEWGIGYIKEALDVTRKKKCHYKLIAGDINNNPHNEPSHFNLITEARFDILEADSSTNINSRDVEYRDRKIDYIFTPAKSKVPILERIWYVLTGLFVSRIECSFTPAKVLRDFDFTFESNCSDHKPVGLIITITTQSKIVRLWNFLKNAIKTLFRVG